MRYDQNETGLSQYSFIARDDSKLLVFPLEVFPLNALLESPLPCLEAPLKLLLLDGSQGFCHVLFDVLNPFNCYPLRTPLIFGNNQYWHGTKSG